MRAEIKSLSSLEIDDLENYAPPDPDIFRVSMCLVAGPQGEQGEETFDFQVCSPRWLEQDLREGEVVLLRHKLIMKSFDFTKVRRFVERYVRGIEGKDWEEVANKLARLGHWEFEDYRE
jgi:hypothetical protein